MAIVARLAPGETLGDRVLRVDHAGEHGAVCIYRMQRWIARWRAPHLLPEIEAFIGHEQRHRALFAAEIERRGQVRCLSYPVCGTLGTLLGVVTGLMGAQAIAATTVAIERVVLRHLSEQMVELADDPAATAVIGAIIADEQQHHDHSAARVRDGWLQRVIDHGVGAVTEAVIWIGMRR